MVIAMFTPASVAFSQLRPLQAMSEEFRYEHDLITGEETERGQGALVRFEVELIGGDLLDAPGEVERLIAAELIAPRLVGSGFLAARDAARATAVCQLPSEKKGRPVLIDRAPLHRESAADFR